MEGFFITFEGLEGAGKSTQARRLWSSLVDKGYPCIFTAEPGGTRIGEEIKKIIANLDYKELTPFAELLLFCADRAQHVHQLVRPQLEEGNIIVCDRFADASLAYQGFGRSIPLNVVSELNSGATWGVKPHLTFYLDIDPAKGLRRVARRIEETETPADRIEKESVDFFRRVREGYLQIAKDEPARMRVVKGDDPVDTVAENIMNIALKELHRKGVHPKLQMGK